MHRHRADLRVPAAPRVVARRAPAAWTSAFGRARLGLLLAGLVVFWLFVSGLAAGCGRAGPPGDSYEIVGLVVEAAGDGTHGPPVGGATVRFQSDTGRTAETVSEGNGRYRIYVLSDTRFGQVTATADGYREARRTVYFDTPQRRLDLALSRVEMPAEAP
ncbi:MAG: hypothetical protein OHK0013_17450 [Sandaracinaceae bacterium]